MIRSFTCRQTEMLWIKGIAPKFPIHARKVGLRKLSQLEAATSLGDLRAAPGNKVRPYREGMRGHLLELGEGYYLAFEWAGAYAMKVAIIERHNL